MRRTWLAVSLIAVLIGACSSTNPAPTGSGPAPTGSGRAPSGSCGAGLAGASSACLTPPAASPAAAASPASTSLFGTLPTSMPPAATPAPPTAGPTNRSSQALVQVVNIYAPGVEAPFAIDVYGGQPTDASVKPLATVQYGSVSAAFDPTVDSTGNATLWFYRAGSRGTADQLATQVLAISGPDRFTVDINDYNIAGDDGRFPVGVESFNDRTGGPDNNDGFATPRPEDALLWFVSTGLDNVWFSLPRTNYVKVGDVCLGIYGNEDQSTPGPAVLGVPTAFSVKAGAAPAIVYTRNMSDPPQCTGTPATDPVTVNVAANGYGYLFVFAPDQNTLRALFVASLH